MTVKHTKIDFIKNKMNILFFLFLNFSISLNIFNCSNSRKQDNLPDARPENLVIEYYISGGMRYYSEALYISGDSSYYTVNDAGAISRINFILKPGELDELYRVFVDSEFDDIKTYEEKVYDRGGSSIYISWEKSKFTSVSNSGMTFISDSWKNEWGACVSALDKIIDKQLELQNKVYEITFGKSFFGKEVNAYINTHKVVPESVLTAEHDYDTSITKTVNVIPGKHILNISRGKSYDIIKIDADSSNGIYLNIVNDSLKYSFIH